jgi:hypothetical protein
MAAQNAGRVLQSNVELVTIGKRLPHTLFDLHALSLTATFSLQMNFRTMQRRIVAFPEVGGLHHHYERRDQNRGILWWWLWWFLSSKIQGVHPVTGQRAGKPKKAQNHCCPMAWAF